MAPWHGRSHGFASGAELMSALPQMSRTLLKKIARKRAKKINNKARAAEQRSRKMVSNPAHDPAAKLRRDRE
jgi:hypothetical protein